jgi:hypothetical protein
MSALSLLSNEDKKIIERVRQKAIRDALKYERELVTLGKGTRQWSLEQQKDILAGYRPRDVNGVAFEGHHMISVSEHPEYAGRADNIQWLNSDEHINGAHKGSTKNPTNGYYDPTTGEMTLFEGEPVAPPVINLDEPLVLTQETTLTVTNEVLIVAEKTVEAESVVIAEKVAEAAMTLTETIVEMAVM